MPEIVVVLCSFVAMRAAHSTSRAMSAPLRDADARRVRLALPGPRGRRDEADAVALVLEDAEGREARNRALRLRRRQGAAAAPEAASRPGQGRGGGKLAADIVLDQVK